MSDKETLLTREQVLSLLDFDQEAGRFYWKHSRGPRRAGAEAGSFDRLGYRRVKINGHAYSSHRLVWLCIHGEWPPQHIDHINGDPADNHPANLRSVTPTQNHWNRAGMRGSASGLKGAYCVHRHRASPKRWQSRIKVSGVNYHLGYFYTAEEASEAYHKAAHELCGEFARAPL